MEQVDGIFAAREIRETDRSVLFIYISGYDKYLKELFEVEPFRFLSKPLGKEKFCRYFQEACRRIGETEVFYQFTFNKKNSKSIYEGYRIFRKPQSCGVYLSAGWQFGILLWKTEYGRKRAGGQQELFFAYLQSILMNYVYIVKMNFSPITISFNGKETVLKISENHQKEVRHQLCEMSYRRFSYDKETE